jgi:hypothetical protein
MSDTVENMASFSAIGTNQVRAYSDDSSGIQNLLLAASGNIEIDSDTFEMTGDIVVNSNLVVNSTVYFGDVNVFREFDDGHTISYGMRISDDEKLQFFKHDSRKNKSVIVNEFGMGAITDNNKSYSESTTGKLNGLFNKANRVTKKRG